jgi:dynein heavy chain, axonemal
VLSNMTDANWGKLEGKEGQMAKVDFLSKLSTFVSTLQGAQESINERVILKPSDKYDLTQLKTANDYVNAAGNSEALSSIEEIVRVWTKQIELVLAESEQIRREADNIGPRAELDYWKKRTSKFNYLLDQLKEQRVKAAIGVLQAAKSRMLAKWKELDMRITDSANEARDNVKYLYTLERFCDPLYNSDPVAMLNDIPGLINAIRMIHSISRYYNTSERMTSLFLKVTNQMITSCKSYITDKGTQTCWSQPQADVIKKLNDSIRLNREYESCFQRTKEKISKMPEERPFDFSEMYIFGKFDAFTKRCQKIIDVFETINVYSRLQESKIEGTNKFYFFLFIYFFPNFFIFIFYFIILTYQSKGIEMLSAKFNGIVTLFKKKPYDLLDHRKIDFDNDYDDFKKSIQDLHVSQLIRLIFN